MAYNNAGISGLTGPDSHESPDILQRLDMYRGYPSEKLGPIASNGDLAAVSVLADRKDQERRQKENAAKNPTTTAIEDLIARNNFPVGSNSLPQMPQGRPGMQGADTAMPNMGSPPGAGMIGASSSPGMGLASQGPPTGSQMPPAGFNQQQVPGQPPVMGAKDGGLVDRFRRSGVRGFSGEYGKSGSLMTPSQRDALDAYNRWGVPLPPGHPSYDTGLEVYAQESHADRYRAEQEASGMKVGRYRDLPIPRSEISYRLPFRRDELGGEYGPGQAPHVPASDLMPPVQGMKYNFNTEPRETFDTGADVPGQKFGRFLKAMSKIDIPDVLRWDPDHPSLHTNDDWTSNSEYYKGKGKHVRDIIGDKIGGAYNAFKGGIDNNPLGRTGSESGHPPGVSLFVDQPWMKRVRENVAQGEPDQDRIAAMEGWNWFGGMFDSDDVGYQNRKKAGGQASEEKGVGGGGGGPKEGVEGRPRPPLLEAGKVDVTAMDMFMDKIEEMQRGKRGMALLAMAAEMGKYHKGGFLPSAVAGMNAAGQSARDTDTQTLKGYGLGAELQLQKEKIANDYAVGMGRNASYASNANEKAYKALTKEQRSLVNDRMKAFDTSADGPRALEALMLGRMGSRDDYRYLQYAFYGGNEIDSTLSGAGDWGQVSPRDRTEARSIVMQALVADVQMQLDIGGSGGGGQINIASLGGKPITASRF